jgi:hypothetical protein
MTPGWFTPLPAMATLKAQADQLSAGGRIDATANLASAPVWLFTGANDATVAREVVEGLHAFYRAYRADAVIVRHKQAGHAMVTQDAGNRDCDATRSPFINDCDYDAAGLMLERLLGKLQPPRPAISGKLMRFDQASFGGKPLSLDDEGYLFVPEACESGGCRVHVAFHGCRQGKSFVAERFVREAGYNRWADANRLIVLYPQAIARYWSPYNPRGCWDWWGYTGAQYHTREGAQIRAVRAMLERLSAPRQ